MTNVKFEALPEELIAHIATCANPSSALNLSQTCRSIRSACYDGLVFKDILITSQYHNWKQSSLNVKAIASRANNDAATWARYAIADERACDLSQRECPLEHPKNFINFLPELFVVGHPFMNGECWNRFLRDRVDQKSNQVFCLALAILAKDDMPQVFRSLQMENDRYLKRGESMKAFLWTLCTTALLVRLSLKTRLAAWPFNDAARVPYISPPKAHQIPLEPLNDKYAIPAPFSRRAMQLLGSSTSSFSSWDSWYRLHNYEAFQSPEYLTEGTWCGYYVHTVFQSGRLDPPMTDIKFRILPDPTTEAPTSDNIQEVNMYADNCIDGIDSFSIRATVSASDNEILFRARKDYKNRRCSWDWDCRLTPFGIVGHWGNNNEENDRLVRYGMVWLWKKEWTETTQQ